MAVKLAFAAGLFCVVFSMFGPGASQEIPDGKVYTELKKTLIHGSSGILTCRFTGPPYAVFWKRGHDPWDSPTLLRWTPEAKTGPRYEDDSCDMTENYSLVIKTVKYTDTGRYICFVSNQHGILIDNYTDVTVIDNALRMEQSVAVQKGEVGAVPCQVNIRPKRVSWVRGANDTLVSIDLSRSVGERSGPGYEEGLFNITSEYSLLINDVKILHENSYFCEVTDFDTGHLFRNVSRLNVFAFPPEPYPSIEECPREQQDLSSCTLRIASQTILTCEVREYYPVTDLFFMHGSLRVDSLETRVWNNSDGTRNKRVTVATYGSRETVYECVATGLVGEAESRSMTIHLIRDTHKQTHVAVAVVVPIILVSAIIVIAVYGIKRRKRHMKPKYNKVLIVYNVNQRDRISYIELWTLVKYAREQNLSDKLGKALDQPIKDEEGYKTLGTDKDYYQECCQWKAGYTGTCQREDFFDACRRAGLKSAIDKLQEYSDSTRAVTADDLEHTLWNIAESDRITGFLEDLGAPHKHLEVLKGNGKREVIEGAMNILKHWSDVNSAGNQEVMLSLALEAIKNIPSDNDFFRIPDCLKRGLDKNEIQTFLSPQITSRHCTELINAMTDSENSWAIKLFGSKKKNVFIDDVIEENRTALFDSHQMIQDWWAEQNCSNYEKRDRLCRASNVPKVPHDDLKESDEKWPATKKLQQIAKLVPEQSMIQLSRALNIPCTPGYLIDEKNRLEAMSRWREKVAEQKQDKKQRELSEALKAINFDGLLSRPESGLIYKVELVDLALDLILEDFRPFSTALGISENKLTSYRQEFRSSHLGVGSISLVLQLVKMYRIVPIPFFSILDKAGYPNAMKRFKFAVEPSYGELLAIATAVIKDDETKVDMEFTKTNEEKKSYGSSVVVMDQTPSNDIGDLQRMLELTDEDIPDSNTASVLHLLKIWKKRMYPGLIDHRVVLAEGLQKINKPHLVAAVMNGQYQFGETSIDFIEDMLDGEHLFNVC